MHAVVRAAAFVLWGSLALGAQEHIERQSRNFTIDMHPGQLPVPLATWFDALRVESSAPAPVKKT